METNSRRNSISGWRRGEGSSSGRRRRRRQHRSPLPGNQLARELKHLLGRAGSPRRVGFRITAGILALVTAIGVFSIGGVAYAATTAVHEITGTWVNPPASVPSGSVVTSEWRINTNDAANPQANDPVNNVRVTLVATNGVFVGIPPVCKTTGVTPVSSVSADGKTLVCNLGTITEGTATVISAPIRANGAAGSQVSATGSVTSDSATTTVAAAAPLPGIPITTTHGFDLRLASAPGTSYQGIPNAAGRPVLLVDFSIVLDPGSVPGPANYTFPLTVSSTAVAGMIAEGCVPLSGAAAAVAQPFSDPAQANRTNFPGCTVAGSGANYTVSLTGIDYTLVHTPTLDSLGNPLPIGSYVASGTVQLSIPAPVAAGFSFTATPPPFTFADGVAGTDNNAADNQSTTTTSLPGGLASTWFAPGRSNWDDKLFVSPGQTDNYPIVPSSATGQPLVSDGHSAMWNGYTGPGGADLAGVCTLYSNPSLFTPRAVSVSAFNMTGPVTPSPVPSVHFWYSTQTFNTHTETCGEPVNSSTWIAVTDPNNLPAGVTAVKMTWDPAVSREVNHVVLVYGDIPSSAPAGAENWEVVAANSPTRGWFNDSDLLGPVTPTPWSTYAPYTSQYRDVYRVVSQTGTITKTTPETTAVPGTPVPYTIQVSAQGSSTTPPPPTTITVVDTLPAGMSYVAGSGSPAPSSVSGQTVTWTLPNSTANVQYPITYQAVLAANSGLAPGSTLTNSAEVQVPGDVRPAAARTATASVVTTNTSSTQFGKSVEANTLSFYGDSSAWDLTVSSYDPVSNPFTDTIDILPALGDGRGTTIDGTYTITGVTAPAGSTVYYSIAPVGALSNDPRAASNGGTPGSVTGNTVGWTTVKPSAPTAIRVIGPALAPGAVQNIRIAFTTPAGTNCAAPATGDNKPGQLLVNSANSIAGHTQLPMLSSAKTTIGDCYALDLKKYVLAKGGNPSPTDPATNTSWLDANTPAGYAQYAAGDNVSFEVVVANKGTGALTNITVSDPLAPGCGGTIANLAAGATQVFSCQLTAAVGTTVNTATASVTPPAGPALNATDPAGFVVPEPYTVTKTSDAGAFVTTGTVVKYSITITEPASSAAPYLNPSISDDLSGVLDDATFNNDAQATAGGTPTITGNTLTWSAASIMPGQTITITYSATVNTPDTGDKVLKNTVVTPTGASNCPAGSTDSACTVTVPVQTPGIALVKSVAETTLTLGETLHYSYVVTNTGNTTLAPVTVTETAFSGTGTAPVISCPAGAASLAAGAQVTCTATYVVTQADVDAGIVTNTAVTNGTVPNGPNVTSAPSSAQVPSTPAPGQSFSKTADSSAVTPPAKAGQVITYHFASTNTGNVTLTNVAITDQLAGLSALTYTWPGTVGTLLPGQTVTATATYSITQADVDAGHVANTATATGTDPSGGKTTPPPGNTDTPLPPVPGQSFSKTADSSAVGSPAKVGEVITYHFASQNTGNVTLTGVTIQDQLAGLSALTYSWPGTAGTLLPGQTVTATATYAITQADIDAGHVANTALASGTTPSGGKTTPPPGSTDTPLTSAPGQSFSKTADSSALGSPAKVGDVITYHFTSQNTGNVTLTGVTIQDQLAGLSALTYTWPGTAGTLLPGQTVTATATYAITQADIDAGHVANTATATGTDPSGGKTTPPPGSTDTPLPAAPGQSFSKTADSSAVGSPAKVGDVITYNFTSQNTGNVTLTGVTITDQLAGLSALTYTWPGTAGTLLPGQTVTAKATYAITQADIDAGHVANTALASGTDPSGGKTTPPAGSTDTPLPLVPALSLVKSADKTELVAGETITYSFVGTNTGNVTLTGVAIADPMPGLSALTYTWPGTAGTLLPGQSVTAKATYVVTQADVDAGTVSNTATVTGTPPTGPAVTGTDSVKVPGTQTLGQSITKTADSSAVGSPARVGDVITYHFTSTNTGNVTLTKVAISDQLAGLSALNYTWPAGGTAGTLLPGQTVTATATYAITQADIDAGKVTNSALPIGEDAGGARPTPPAPAVAVVELPPVPAGLATTGSLAYTGASLLGLPIALLLLLGGGIFLIAAKRRRNRH